ncbi:MAG: hypothetical protein DMG32_04410 [Acidobacteria bacterium]|nr:MAG: hypothetical protein DMG32_04410 [Acidobacteriota bacterium]
MIDAIRLLAGAILRLFRARRRLLLENLALRQQLAALKKRHPRPKLGALDKLFVGSGNFGRSIPEILAPSAVAGKCSCPSN